MPPRQKIQKTGCAGGGSGTNTKSGSSGRVSGGNGGSSSGVGLGYGRDGSSNGGKRGSSSSKIPSVAIFSNHFCSLLVLNPFDKRLPNAQGRHDEFFEEGDAMSCCKNLVLCEFSLILGIVMSARKPNLCPCVCVCVCVWLCVRV